MNNLLQIYPIRVLFPLRGSQRTETKDSIAANQLVQWSRFPLRPPRERQLLFASITQNGPYNFKREPLPFQKPRKPPPAGLSVKALHRIDFFPRNLLRGLDLRFIDKNLCKDLPDNLPVYPLVLEFLLDPAPAEPPKPYPAPRPLVRKLSIIHITEPRQVVKNSRDDRGIKFLIVKLCFKLRPASRPEGE